MPGRRCPLRFLVAFAVLQGVAISASAQTISIVSVDAGVPDLGTLASAASGDTHFRIAPETGQVIKLGGTGTRTSGGSTRARVVVTCTDDDACPSTSQTITITQFGSPTGRARSLANFTVAPGADPPTLGPPSGTNTVTFDVSGIPRGGTRDFYLGMDFGIADSGPSGLATAGFLVSVPSGSASGTARATVLRTLSLGKMSDLSFGTIVRPASGSGTVTLEASSAALDVTGTGALALASAASAAQYVVTGEGGQAFSIDMTIERPLTMTGPGTLPVTLNTDADPSPILSGTAGTEGSYSFRIGGSFPVGHDTPAGYYSGSFLVTVLYD